MKVLTADKDHSAAELGCSDDVFIYGEASDKVTVMPEDFIAFLFEWCTKIVGSKGPILVSKG